MTEKIRRGATEQIVGAVQRVDMAVKSAAVETAEGRADTEKKTVEATVPRTAAAKSAVHTHVRKEQRLPVMHRLKSSRRIAVS